MRENNNPFIDHLWWKRTALALEGANRTQNIHNTNYENTNLNVVQYNKIVDAPIKTLRL